MCDPFSLISISWKHFYLIIYSVKLRLLFFFLISFSLYIDLRTKPWLLSDNPGPLVTILVTYLYFCLHAGPKYMKDRKPFDLKNTLIVYNVIQVLLSVYLVFEVSEKKIYFLHLRRKKTWHKEGIMFKDIQFWLD